MTDEIQVPIVYITDGWTVDDIQNENDCDDAFAVLTALCANIESRMDELVIEGHEISHEYRRAKVALRWKKAALSIVHNKRGLFRRQQEEQQNKQRENNLVLYFAAMYPDAYQEAVNHHKAGTVQLALQRE